MSISLNDVITYGNAKFKVVKIMTSKDVNDLSNALNSKLDEHNLYEENFAILYPAGGIASNPNSVATNTKYALNNPFPGYLIDCRLQFLYNNKWCDVTVQTIPSYSVRGAYVVSNETNIYVYTSNYIAINTSDYQFTFPSGTDNVLSNYVYTAPMRVLVWKVGKINVD